MQDRRPPPSPARAVSPRHGGDLGDVTENSVFSGTWIDLSTGINPWPYPLGEVPAARAARLPDAALLGDLGNAAARYYAAAGPDLVVAAPGSEALIQLLPRLVLPARVAILSPTYSGHAPAWRAAGHEVARVADLDALEGARVDFAVATNPNNPDGARLDPARLENIAAGFGARGGLLVVDEAFADTEPSLSLARKVGMPGLVVLRSFGKFFGLAGLRLGFALAAPDLAARITAALGPWPVSGPAAWIATRAFADRAWIEATQRRLAASAARLDGILRAGGLEIVGGTSLFRLAASPRAPEIDAALRAHGLYARRFPEREDWLRFALPPDAHAEARLAAALASVDAARTPLHAFEVSP